MATQDVEFTDPHALPVIRGRARRLDPVFNPESPRSLVRWRSSLKRSTRPLCVSLWSGAGGLDLGLERAGFRVAVAADWDEWACQTHGYNSEALVFCRDLADPDNVKAWLETLDLPPVSLVAAGFPCQPYSRAGHSIMRHLVREGKRPELDLRTFAWLSFVAAVEALQPAHAIAENVPDLARYDDGAQLQIISESLEALGYVVDFRILSARQYGVPQYRERLIIQAAKTPASIAWPEPTGGRDDLFHAIGDLPEIEPGHAVDEMPYAPRDARPRPHWATQGGEGDHTLLTDHVCRDVRQDDLEAFAHLEPGGTYLDVPAELRRYDHEQFTDKYKRLEWDKPSRTITAHIARDGYWYIHPDQHRTLSIREAARVQTFPDSYVFAGHPSNRLQQIGNAVPPLLGEAIGRALVDGAQGAAAGGEVVGASALLQIAARRDRVPADDWAILVSESVFGGRAGAERVRAFLDIYPTPDAALSIRGRSRHERLARDIARHLQSMAGGALRTPEALAGVPGLTPAGRDLVAALTGGGTVPVSSGTTRVASRVSGISKKGTLNGVVGVVLARLSNFGRDPGVNRLLVDLSRSVCTPESPACNACLLRESCRHAAEADLTTGTAQQLSLGGDLRRPH